MSLLHIRPGVRDRQWRARVSGTPQTAEFLERIHQLLRRFLIAPGPGIGQHLTNTGFSLHQNPDPACAPLPFPDAPFPWAAPLHQHLATIRYGHPSAEQAQTAMLAVPKGLLIGNGTPVTPAGGLPDTSESKAFFAHDLRLNQKPYAGLADCFNGKLLALTGNCGFNYFHFMLEQLPRLAIARSHGITFDAVYAALDYPFQIDALKLAGVLDRAFASESRRKIRANQVVVPSMPNSHCMPTQLALDFLDAIAKPHTLHRRQHRRIFISRRNSKIRRLLNWAGVQSILEPYGFVPHDLDGLTVPEQAALFAECEAVVATHGAALTNLAFCQPGTKVLEIMHPSHVFWAYGLISSARNLVYAAVEAEEARSWTTDTNFCKADMTVSSGQLARIREWVRHSLSTG